MSQPAIIVDPSTFLSGLVDALQRLFFGNTARRYIEPSGLNTLP
jgi:hypothetical protein